VRILTLSSNRWAKWAVLVFWIAMLGVFGSLSGQLSSVEKNDVITLLPKKAESTQVAELSKRLVPNINSAVVVYDRGGGTVTAADQAVAAVDAQRFARIARVSTPIVGPIVAKDGRALQLVVPINTDSAGQTGSSDTATAVKAMRSILRSHPGLTAHVTGPAGYAADQSDAFSGTDKALLYLTVAIVIAILLLTYRSPVLWVVPLICVGVALTVAQGRSTYSPGTRA
jgi:Predicted drug exporters of the RND superfamily